MAVEASRNCLGGRSTEKVDGLFFATTTAPYKEKMNASLIATAADLKREITTADFAHSLRAGTGALKAAFDSVKSGSMSNVLVVASDCRIGYPRSDQEQTFGDGSGAVMVSSENLVATFEGSYSICNEMMDVWRNPEDTFVRTWEGRFILGEGYINHMKEVVSGLLRKCNLEPKEISKACPGHAVSHESGKTTGIPYGDTGSRSFAVERWTLRFCTFPADAGGGP
jgi:3-hydroxy-3-methylglutaryl CoA synthase